MSYGKKNKKIPSPGSSPPGVSQDAGSIGPDSKPLILIFAKKLRSGYSRPVSNDSVQTCHALAYIRLEPGALTELAFDRRASPT